MNDVHAVYIKAERNQMKTDRNETCKGAQASSTVSSCELKLHGSKQGITSLRAHYLRALLTLNGSSSTVFFSLIILSIVAWRTCCKYGIARTCSRKKKKENIL